MRHLMLLAAAASTFVAAPVLAKGCLRGAAVGAVAGHFVGKGHAVAGAVAGCLIARHHYAKQKAEQQARAHQQNGSRRW